MNIPATKAHMNNVRPNIGINIVFAINKYLNLETCSHKRGNWIMMKRKKQSICAEVTCALAGI